MVEQQTVLITGGTSGVGSYLCKHLTLLGHNVAFTFNSNKEDAEKLLEELRETNERTIAYKVDVTNETEVKELFEKINESFGNIDSVINNAGIYSDSLVKNMDLQDWIKVLNVNLNGTFLCTKHAIPYMETNGFGRIINIGSVVGQIGAIGAANYAASKSAIEGFTKSVAREVARKGITANVIALGYIDEGMGKRIPDKIKEKVIGQIPVMKFAEPDAVAHTIDFLLSKQSYYVTGQTINVNGGLFM